MPLITWKPEFSVGIMEIDAQHHGLIDIINKLHEAMLMGGKNTAIGAVLDDLTTYTKYHFAFEERMMAAVGYAELPEHQRKHRAMVSRVVAFRTEIQGGSASASLKLMTFLKEWLSRHIMETDQQYKEQLAKRVA